MSDRASAVGMRRAAWVCAALASLIPGQVSGQDEARKIPGQSADAGQFEHLFGDGEIDIEIEKKVEREVKPPIAVPAGLLPDTSAGPHGQTIAEILRFDFEISGEFSGVAPERTSLDVGEGMEVEEIDFARWSGAGARYLVKSRYALDDKGRASLDMRLYSVDKRQRLDLNWTPPTEVPPDKLRDAVHGFANAVVEYMTGISGPFGTRLLVARLEGDTKNIYAMDTDGARQVKLTDNGSINVLPSWGDDQDVFFTSYLRDNPDLYVRRGDKTVLVSSVPGTNHGAEYCNGKVAVTLSMGATNNDIYLLDASNGRIKARLTDHWGIDTSPTWSPDCSRIAFVSNRGGSPQIYVMNADGSDQRRLTFSGRHNTTPAWSPGGNEIAFTGFTGGGTDIFVTDLEGYIKRLTYGPGNKEHPTWSPRGNFIAYIKQRGETPPQLYIMPSSGWRHTRITQDDGIYATPDWRRQEP